jgi:hypothetical protein
MTRNPLDAGRLHALRSPSAQIGPTPDYEGEADRGRLELGGDDLDRMAFSRNGRRTLGDEIAAVTAGR